MKEIITDMPVLGIAMLINIALGVYYSIGIQSLSFDYKKLLNGMLKALLIGASFLGIAYCFDGTDLSSIGITPEFVMNSAIILYTGKDLTTLSKILGVDTTRRDAM